MERMVSSPHSSAPRRFVLIPEEAALSGSFGTRVRRYKLSSVGQGARTRRPSPAGLDPARGAGPHGLARLEGA